MAVLLATPIGVCGLDQFHPPQARMPVLADDDVSCTDMPSGVAMSTIALVIWMSACEGVRSPLGWLCTRIIVNVGAIETGIESHNSDGLKLPEDAIGDCSMLTARWRYRSIPETPLSAVAGWSLPNLELHRHGRSSRREVPID